MMNSKITTALASAPIWAQRCTGSQPTLPVSWSKKSDQTCICRCKNIVISLSCELNFLLLHYRRSMRSAGLLLTQRKVHVDGGLHLHRLTIQQRWFVTPLLHRVERRL